MSFQDVWGQQVIVVGDQSITVGRIVVALVLLAVGYVVSSTLSRAMRRRLPRLGLTESTAATLQTLVFYLLLVSFALVSLRMVHIPITAFTLLGGALAIGVGFGSQNIVNNFISGLILLAERPIKVGDLIDVDGTFGTVEHIGARSTRVRSADNIHVIVPNSAFLEKNVVNWTLSDDLVRLHLRVGVAYGSPTREVSRLIRQAVDEHPNVLNSPEPVVLFREFGDNSLNFEVRFWIRMRAMIDRLRVESDLHFRIDELFRRAGIVIAFPQRDVHLDTTRPLAVRFAGESEDDDGAEPTK